MARCSGWKMGCRCTCCHAANKADCDTNDHADGNTDAARFEWSTTRAPGGVSPPAIARRSMCRRTR